MASLVLHAEGTAVATLDSVLLSWRLTSQWAQDTGAVVGKLLDSTCSSGRGGFASEI
jgi:hypothetical protein